MAQTEQEILVRILTTETGFYWTLSVDEEGAFVEAGKEETLIGPFATHAAALTDAQKFIEDAVNGADEQEITQ